MSSYYSVVFGNDHKNPLGAIQSLGQMGIYSDAVCWGARTGLVKSSRFTKNIYYGDRAEDCIQLLLRDVANNHKGEIGVITPCSDEAAVTLEKNKQLLLGLFVFEHSDKYSIQEMMDKGLQMRIAKEAGLDVPESYSIFNIGDIPEEISFPCIIKPLSSMKGAKSDLRVVYNRDDLLFNVEDVLKGCYGIILQRYIDKEYEFEIECCRLSNGDTLAPVIVKSSLDRLYPKNVGLSSYHEVIPFFDTVMKDKINRFFDLMGYVGLISVEFAKSKSSGKSYFYECNIRNSGFNPCCTKAGVNINYYHYCDLCNSDFTVGLAKQIDVISEERHLLSVTHGYISIFQWLKDFHIADSFTWYYRSDKKPFFKGLFNLVTEIIKYRIIIPLQKKK